jgi:7-carboxy-7-deazaguanine synthase
MLPVNEVYESVQGEGVHAGKPCLVIRVQGCGVGCPWCNVKHSWVIDGNSTVPLSAIVERKDVLGNCYALASIAALVDIAKGSAAAHVVITGGEPALYDLRELTGQLIGIGKTVQITTSGTEDVRADPKTWITVSPKMHMPRGRLVRRAVLEQADEIVFPVALNSDINALEEFLFLIGGHDQVWLQPIGGTSGHLRRCIDAAAQRGWRVSIAPESNLGR